MKYVIYLDAFFLMNFSLDLIALLICGKIRGCMLKIFRNIAAALIGACMACAYLINPFNISSYGRIVSCMIAGGVMTMTAYGYTNLKKYLWDFVVLFTVMLAAGGLGNVLYFGLGLKNIPLIILGMAILGLCMSKYLGRTYDMNRRCYRVTIQNGGNVVVTDALVDTGNCLTEPYGSRPVNIIGYSEAMNLIKGRDIYSQRGYMKIPFHSVGESNGLMDGFVADKICIELQNRMVCKENVVVGICEGSVSAGNKYGAIINPAMLNTNN